MTAKNSKRESPKVTDQMKTKVSNEFVSISNILGLGWDDSLLLQISEPKFFPSKSRYIYFNDLFPLQDSEKSWKRLIFNPRMGQSTKIAWSWEISGGGGPLPLPDPPFYPDAGLTQYSFFKDCMKLIIIYMQNTLDLYTRLGLGQNARLGEFWGSS